MKALRSLGLVYDHDGLRVLDHWSKDLGRLPL